MSFNSLTGIRLSSISTYLVDQMQKIFPDKALECVNLKINIIRNEIATMSSSAPSLYSSTPAPSSISGPIKFMGVNLLKEDFTRAIDNVKICVPGEATYTFPIFKSSFTLNNHRMLFHINGMGRLHIDEIKEYMFDKKNLPHDQKLFNLSSLVY